MKLETRPVETGRKTVKCPTKRTINLAKREGESRSAATLAVGAVLIALLSFGVAKFGVIDQLARQHEAERAYEAVHARYVQMQSALASYPEVEEEYHTYSRKWMQTEDAGFVSVDRLEVLDLLEQSLMPCGEIRSVSVQGSMMVVSMSGMNLEQISAMIERMQKQEIVSGATLNMASTTDKEQTDNLDFSITISLKAKEAAQ